MVVSRLGLLVTLAASFCSVSAAPCTETVTTTVTATAATTAATSSSTSASTSSTTTSGTGILLPLYYDPPSGTCYSDMVAAYKANPSIPWTIIINPDSGWSTTGNQAMVACIPSLRSSMPTAKLIGYCLTGYGTRSQSYVYQQVAGYKTVNLDGIYFDETETDSSMLVTYQAYVQVAKTAFGDSAFIAMNPGTAVVDTGFWQIANLIQTFENPYANFNTTPLLASGQQPSQAAICIYTLPTANENTITQNLIDSLVPKFAALYFTDLAGPSSNPYASLGSQFSTFVNQVGAKQ